MATTHLSHRTAAPAASRRTGYLAAAIVNLIMLWLVNQLPERHWPPFLTSSFEDLLPIVNLSLLGSVAVNLLWAWSDPDWFKHLAQIGLNVVGVAVAVSTWQVFPFDFSAYEGPWEAVTRMVIALGLFGLAVSTIVELVQLGRLALGRPGPG